MNALAEEAETPKVAAKPRRPGSVLRDERRTQGLSIDEVAEELRLPPRYVNALETGEYSKLPGDTFARGYLRNYAAFLDIDPAPLLEVFARTVQPNKNVATEPAANKKKPAGMGSKPERTGVPSWVWIGVASALILGAWLSGAFQSGEPTATPMGPGQAQTPASPPAPEQLVIDTTLETSPAQTETGTPDTDPGSPAALEPALPVVSAEPAAAIVDPGAEFATGGAEAADLAPAEALVIAFSEDCWIRIRDAAGNTLAFGVQKAGELLRFDAGAPYSLLIGNVGGVLVSYNGEPVDLAPYNDKNVAKFTLK